MVTNNAINLSAQGMAYYNGSGVFSAPALTQFGVVVGAAANDISSLAVGATGTVLIGNSGANPSFSTSLSLTSVTLTTPLSVSSGGTGDTSFTANAIILSGATSTAALTSTALTNGQVLIGSTGVAPVASTLTAGTGISITPAAGSITIATSGSGSAWVDVTTSTQAMSVNTGYIADDATVGVTFTLPTSATWGDSVTVMGKQFGWTVKYAAGQNIVVGDLTSTTATGSVASTTASDCIHLICTTANATAPIFSTLGIQGNLSIT